MRATNNAVYYGNRMRNSVGVPVIYITYGCLSFTPQALTRSHRERWSFRAQLHFDDVQRHHVRPSTWRASAKPGAKASWRILPSVRWRSTQDWRGALHGFVATVCGGTLGRAWTCRSGRTKDSRHEGAHRRWLLNGEHEGQMSNVVLG